MMGSRRRTSRGPWRSRLRAVDAVSTATLGIRTRKGRAVLTALGIAIGIAAILAVIGITSSSKAELIAQIDALGTNLLQVRPGNDLFGEDSTLPPDAPSMIRRIAPVQAATSLIKLNATVRPTPFVSRDDPIGIDLYAAEPNLIDTLDGRMASGHFFDSGTDDLPVVVLGSVAAQRLGIDTVEGGRNVLIAGKWFNLIGVVDPLQLNPDIDRAAIIGQDIAVDLFGIKRNASVIYLRAEPEYVEEVRGVLAATANPAAPNEVEVSRPSEALEARAQVDKNLQTLLLSLGAVALLVGAIGIANVMVISVLERRSEIGVRRALGATRAHIGIQFIMESALLAFMGGVLGIGIGAAVTYAYARSQDWLGTVPLVALAGSVAVTLLLGVISGLYPAVRAARLDPVEAIRPTT